MFEENILKSHLVLNSLPAAVFIPCGLSSRLGSWGLQILDSFDVSKSPGVVMAIVGII